MGKQPKYLVELLASGPLVHPALLIVLGLMVPLDPPGGIYVYSKG